MGRLLLFAGIVIAVLGLLTMAGLPVGRLPGDVAFRRGNTTIYFPLTTSILLSIILTLLFAILRR
jgi:hypothetical protein